MSKRDGFLAGTFNCGECGRLTRNTSRGNSLLCPQCDERTMIENGICDGGYRGQALIDAEARIASLVEEAARRGGVFAGGA